MKTEIIPRKRHYHVAKFTIRDEGVPYFLDWYRKGDETWRGHLEWCCDEFECLEAYLVQSETSDVDGAKTFYAVYVFENAELKSKGLSTPELPAMLEHGKLLAPFKADKSYDIELDEVLVCKPLK